MRKITPSAVPPSTAPLAPKLSTINQIHGRRRSVVEQAWTSLISVATCQVISAKALDLFKHLLGFPYVAVTLFLSVRFLIASQSTLENDLFWPEFNATCMGTVVANIFNNLLLGRQHEHFKLTTAEHATLDTLSMKSPQITFASTYPRSLLYHQLNTPQHAIIGLRRNESMPHMMFQQTQFCWVDFDRRFSLAHTEKRAKRCLANDKTNGAVYLETYLRNFNSKMFLQSWQQEYANGIEAPLGESLEGRAFLKQIQAIWQSSNNLSVEDEAEYWQDQGITHFTMQRGNFFDPGVTERISLVSALGVNVNFTIKAMLPVNPGQKTALKLYWTPAADLWAVGEDTTNISGMSLVRGTSKFYENFNITMEQVVINDGTLPWPLTPKDQMLRDAVGPFGSIDTKHLMFPETLFDFLMNGTRIIHQRVLMNSSALVSYALVPDKMTWKIWPIAWRTLQQDMQTRVWSSVGGNPLCSGGTSVPYMQTPIDFADSCATAVQEAVYATRLMLILSWVALKNVSNDTIETICASGMSMATACEAGLLNATRFTDEYLLDEDQQLIQSLAETARQDLLQLNPELIQFAVNNSNSSHYELLRQPLMTFDPADPWNFFGWCYAIEWATGIREVFRLEGDDGTLTLISARTSLKRIDARDSEIPSSLSLSFLRVVQYTTLVSIVCAFLALVYSLTSRGNIAGANLLKFGRVTGTVWIGRPLLVARGIVAICMMSTSDVKLTNRLHEFFKLGETRKTWYNVIIAAGESCWLSYVVTDVLVTFTQGYTNQYAPISSQLVYLINAFVDLVMPVEHSAEIDLQCEMMIFYEDILCHSGRVEVGSRARFIITAAVAIGVTLLTFILVRCFKSPSPIVQGGNMLLSGIAKEVYVSDGWVHEGRWYLDKASAMLTGLVTIQLGDFSRVLDVKSWTLLYLKDNHLYDVKPKQTTCHGHQSLPKAGPRRQLPPKLRYAMALTLGIGGELKVSPGDPMQQRQSPKAIN